MINILYDNQVFAWQKFGGISRYFVEMIKYAADDVIPLLPITFSDNIYLREASFSFFKYVPPFRGSHRITEPANKMCSKLTLRRNSFDLFHPTYYDPYFLKHLKRPYVITVHDMIHERFPNLFNDNMALYKKQSILNADKIIAISDNTKKDIIDIYGIEPSRIDTVYHGVSLAIPLSPKFIPNNFILFTGQRDGYKNFENLCIAFAKLTKTFKNLNLVCTGSKFTTKEISLQNKLGIKNNVFHIFASEAELAYLYKRAICFVYPSLYEGFGIPILEAFGYGCPLCLSNTSCFPEIAESGGAYFDPNDIDSIADTISKVISDSSVRSALIEKGELRLKNFSWKKMAHETASVYKKVLGCNE